MELAESLCNGSGQVQFLDQSFDFRADSQTLEHTSRARECISGEGLVGVFGLRKSKLE